MRGLRFGLLEPEHNIMAKYTVFNTDTNLAEATGRPWPTADGVSQPEGMPANLVLLEEIKASPAYDSATEKLGSYGAPVYDTGAGTATRTREIVALSADEIATAARVATRDAMAANWQSLDAELRGLFHAQYKAVTDLLDSGDDQAAKLLVDGVDPFEVIKNNPTKLATFNAVREQFSAAITALNPAP